MITLGQRSLTSMRGLHPDLCRVIRRAASIATPERDFTILEGLRSRDTMAQNYGKGRTAAECTAKGVDPKYAQPNAAKVTWLKDPFQSNHGVKADGYGHAFDAMPYPIDWKDTPRIHALVALMKEAAGLENVPLVCGADWTGSPDLDHFELGV